MLELLKIKVTGFKLLEDNFELDLTAKTRVYQEDKAKEINKSLYVFRTLAFVGSNSSGKSTVLLLILKTLLFLQTGRWEYIPREFKKNTINLNIVFYLNNCLYEYNTIFNKINEEKISQDNKYSPITKISLKRLSYNKTKGIKNLDLLNLEGENLNELFNSSLDDTSVLKKNHFRVCKYR